VAHAKNTLTGLTHHGKGFRQDFVENWALIFKSAGIGQPLLKR